MSLKFENFEDHSKMYCKLCHARFDHENVGALEHVALSGTVERAGELNAVAHDAARVSQLVPVEEEAR